MVASMSWMDVVIELFLGLLGKRWRIALGMNCGVVAGILVAFHFGAAWGLAVLIICMGLGLIWQRLVSQD